jgi:hypothetical protein
MEYLVRVKKSFVQVQLIIKQSAITSSVSDIPHILSRCTDFIWTSDVLGLVWNHETSKPKPWFVETKPNEGWFYTGFGFGLKPSRETKTNRLNPWFPTYKISWCCSD